MTSDGLRLPRPPGVLRRFWARHPLFADILIALVCFLLSLPPVSAYLPPEGTAAWSVTRPFIVVIVLLACAAVLVRRRWPWVFFAFSLLATASYLLAPYGMLGVPLLLATYTIATYRSTSAAWRAYVLAVSAVVVVGAVVAIASASTWQSVANNIAATVVCGLIGTLIGVNIGGRRRYIEAVLARSQQLWVEREQHAQLAAAAERARIAREMHDVVSHSLTVIVALADGASATTDQTQQRAATELVAATARSALDEMRGMLGVLRDDTTLDAVTADAPLTPIDDDTISLAVDSARAAGLPVVLTTSGTPPPTRSVRLAAARVVQEGLTNVIRHAPTARTVRVDVDYGPDAVALLVVNDGVCPPRGAPGYGLQGLHERVAHVGGTVHAGSDRPGWWRLSVRLPAPDPLLLTGRGGTA